MQSHIAKILSLKVYVLVLTTLSLRQTTQQPQEKGGKIYFVYSSIPLLAGPKTEAAWWKTWAEDSCSFQGSQEAGERKDKPVVIIFQANTVFSADASPENNLAKLTMEETTDKCNIHMIQWPSQRHEDMSFWGSSLDLNHHILLQISKDFRFLMKHVFIKTQSIIKVWRVSTLLKSELQSLFWDPWQTVSCEPI